MLGFDEKILLRNGFPFFQGRFVNCCGDVSPHLLDQFRGDVAPPNEDRRIQQLRKSLLGCVVFVVFFSRSFEKGVKAHNKGILYKRIWVSGIQV